MKLKQKLIIVYQKKKIFDFAIKFWAEYLKTRIDFYI